MVGHGGSSASSYLADPTSPIPSHCASIVATSTVRVKRTYLHVLAYTLFLFSWCHPKLIPVCSVCAYDVNVITTQMCLLCFCPSPILIDACIVI